MHVDVRNNIWIAFIALCTCIEYMRRCMHAIEAQRTYRIICILIFIDLHFQIARRGMQHLVPQGLNRDHIDRNEAPLDVDELRQSLMPEPQAETVVGAYALVDNFQDQYYAIKSVFLRTHRCTNCFSIWTCAWIDLSRHRLFSALYCSRTGLVLPLTAPMIASCVSSPSFESFRVRASRPKFPKSSSS